MLIQSILTAVKSIENQTNDDIGNGESTVAEAVGAAYPRL
jgi:hypothetical protein